MTCYMCKRPVGFATGGYYHRDGVLYCSEECYEAEQQALDEEFPPCKFTAYRRLETGEEAPPHLLGADDEGRSVYLAVEGWEPIGAPYACDEDGNWIVDQGGDA